MSDLRTLQDLPAQRITGWGRTPVVMAPGIRPADLPAAVREQASPALPALPRGLGRSYGDASLPAPGYRYLETGNLDRFISFDENTGVLEAESGVSLATILDLFVPRGWFLPVTPGTRFVTLGGAVASNVHGKNHHHVGSLEHFVTRLEVVTPGGEVRTCGPGPSEDPDLFRATVGGYGLTGLITRVAIKMKPITSPRIRTRGLRRSDLGTLFEAFREHDDGCEYSVAWIDTLARGRGLGRGVLLLGDHAGPSTTSAPSTPSTPSIPWSPTAPSRGKSTKKSRHTLVNIPFSAPSGILQPWALRLFNTSYYLLPRSENEHDAGYEGFFYPLDILGNWNRMYGPKGFFQYQFVIPDPHGSGQGEAGVRACLEFLTKHGMGSFLAVLKRCGDDTVMLPFCKRGFTLALDIPNRGEETLRRLNELDRIVLDYGGRVYLTKDARLSKETFRAMYPEWRGWMETVRRVNPEGSGRSLMAERLGLWD